MVGIKAEHGARGEVGAHVFLREIGGEDLGGVEELDEIFAVLALDELVEEFGGFGGEGGDAGVGDGHDIDMERLVVVFE